MSDSPDTFNKATLVGRLAADPDVRHMPSGRPACSFNVITSEQWKDGNGVPQQRIYGHRVVAYGALVEKVVAPFLKKGSRVMVKGKLHPRSYEANGQTRWIHEVVIDINGRLMLMESKEDAQRRQRGVTQSVHTQNTADEPPESATTTPHEDPFDDDIPF
jgi:single-strand DNA-binding protein